MTTSEPYNTKKLEHLQKVQLMILKDFTKICEENNLNYYVFYGTAIGTVRHNGVIPWDDDIDIVMFREDYEKLIKIMNKEHTTKYTLLEFRNQRQTISLYAQISLNNTIFERWYSQYMDFDIGINIEIFPLDNICNNEFIGKLNFKIIHILHALLINKIMKIESDNIITNTIHKLIRGLMKIIPENHIKTLKKIIFNRMNKYNGQNTEKITNNAGFYGFVSYDKEDFEPAVYGTFEDIQVKLPKNYDKILKEIYGNYMELPPIEKRVPEQLYFIDFGKY